MFSKLGEILGVADHDALRKEFVPFDSPEGTLFLFQYPLALRERIAALTEAEIAEVVPQWALITEFGGMATHEKLTTFLSSLVVFFNTHEGKTGLLMSVR
uniref:hypothetical protein n=1 Tax=Thaumasiovibrio occultus TaxID=1891184 RepID=UPI00131E2282|nr:hypothetical protein [Thaumasiovibrio occultus]